MRATVLPLWLAIGCKADGADPTLAADEPIAEPPHLTYIGEIRKEDLVPGTRSVVDPHEGQRGWPRLILDLDTETGVSLAWIKYRNEGLAEEDWSWIDVGKWHYAWDAVQVLDEVAVDVDAHTFDATMIFVGAQLRGQGTFSEDWATLDLVMQYDLVDPAALVAWTRLGRLTLDYRDEVEDTG